jgi:hypothetical protein
MFKINAAFRLFASAHDEAGKALKSISKILGSTFVIDEVGDNQAVMWRTSLFKAQLVLNTKDDVLEFRFGDKDKAGGFSAEGYNAQTLFKDIRYNVTQFKPSKKLNPKVQEIRDKFGAIQ